MGGNYIYHNQNRIPSHFSNLNLSQNFSTEFPPSGGVTDGKGKDSLGETRGGDEGDEEEEGRTEKVYMVTHQIVLIRSLIGSIH